VEEELVVSRVVGHILLVGLLWFVGIGFLEVGLIGVSFSSEIPPLRSLAWFIAFGFWIYLPHALITASRAEGYQQNLGTTIGWSALLGVVTVIVWAFAAYGVLRAGAAYAGIPWLAMNLFGGFLDGVGIVLRRATDLGVLIIVMLLGGTISGFAGLIWDAVTRSRPAY
jgi:hypothetical protein